MHRIEYIIEVTCGVLEVPVKDVLSKKKAKRYFEARTIVSHIAREESFTYEEIGRVLGRRDHGTIINGCKQAKKWIEADASFVKKLDKVMKFLGDSYGDYLNNDVHVKAITRMDLCISRVAGVMAGLHKEMLELRKLKREFMKQRRRSKPGPSAATPNE